MISDKIIRFHPIELLEPRYAALCLNAGETAKEIEEIKSGMAVMKMIISQPRLRTVMIPLPPLAEQRRIISKVDELMAVCDELVTALADAQAGRGRLLDALLHEAFDADTNEAIKALPLRLDAVLSTQ
jgi:type I restriction enzyme S subunit